MRVYSIADFEQLATQVGTDSTMIPLLEVYQRSRDDLEQAIALNAPHRKLALLQSKRSAARFALSHAIDPNQDARAAREAIATLESRRENELRKIAKRGGHKKTIAELNLKQIDSLLEGQRWLLQFYARGKT